MNTPEYSEAENWLALQLARLPAPVARTVSYLLSFTVGIMVAVVLHYVLYRVGLPSKPFIYVAF